MQQFKNRTNFRMPFDQNNIKHRSNIIYDVNFVLQSFNYRQTEKKRKQIRQTHRMKEVR